MEAARDAHALLAEMGRLLGELEDLVSPPPASPPPLGAALTAGPFSAISAVDDFGAALRELEGVVDVVHRGFAGERALFEVELGVPR